MKKVINLVVLGFGLGCGLVLASAIKNTAPSDMFSKYTNGLPNDITVNTSFEDTNKNLWVGSNMSGLWEKANNTDNFVKVSSGLTPTESIGAINEDASNNLWVGSYGDGLWEKINGSDTFIKVSSGLQTRSINSILEDTNNNLWVGGNGLYEKLSGVDNFIKVSSGLPSDIVIHNILEDSKHNIWIGGNGLYKQANGTDNFIQITSGLSPTESIGAINDDASNNLWVGTENNGLYKKTNVSDNFTKITSIPKTIDINSICQTKNGSIWIGGNGLWEKINGSDNFIQITSGLPNNIVIHNITEDSSHSLWIGSWDGLYVSNSGVGYNLSQGATSTTYNDGTNNWILSNKAITFWARGSNITSININGASYSTGEFSLDGSNYQATSGRYQITVNYSGGKPSEKYYFGIKNRIVSNLGFATLSGDKLEAYTGYLFGDKTRAVKVEYVYDPNFASQAVLNMHLENEYIIDWSQTYLQQLDTTSLKPIGDKIALSASSESVNKDGLYQLVISDKLGNSDIYYIQVGGKTKIIPDTPTPINPSNPTNMAWWEILLIALGVIGGFLLLFFIYARTHMYLTIDRHNKKAHQKPKEKKLKTKK